ncbi:MAG: hypothetical protein OEZ22_05450 [Spirochaetia bacterium]|nr:hypothetical protein [Spirochaetia bacterium]
MKIGEILIKENVITEEELNQALELQKKSFDKLGKILVDMGLLDYMDLIKYLSINHVKPALGELLIATGLIDEDKLNSALEKQKNNPNKKVGNILVESEHLDKNILAHFLTVQASGFISRETEVEIENGHGSIRGNNGSKYTGGIKNGKMHGKGIYSDIECRYVGEFNDGSFHGEGTMTSNEGFVLHSGEWLSGKPVK